jgi:hypothetical protein
MQRKHLDHRRLIAVFILAALVLSFAAQLLPHTLHAQTDPDVASLPKQDFAAAFELPVSQISTHRIVEVTWPADIAPFLPAEDWALIDGSGGGWGSIVWLSGGHTTAAYYLTPAGGLTWRIYQNCATCNANTLPAGVTAGADLVSVTPLPDAPATLPTTGTGGLTVEDPNNDLSVGAALVGATIIAILAALVVLSVYLLLLRRPRAR